MNEIKSAMMFNGTLFEAGDELCIADEAGALRVGTFVRAFPHDNGGMRIRVNVGKEKLILKGEDIKAIWRKTDD